MKFFQILLSGMVVLFQVPFIAAETTNNHGVYYQELKTFKKSPQTKEIFDEDAHYGLSTIQSDIITFKNLTYFQRMVRAAFLALDVVVVTPETMPLLYSYVDGICKKAHIETPTIFITRRKGFFNAAAQKLLMSSGGIVIGQKLMKESSDEALEAIVAHEIGHIKHNHVNKILALSVLNHILFLTLSYKLGLLEINVAETKKGITVNDLGKFYALKVILSYLPSLIINKRFEKQADEFAYKVNGKGAGIIEFFELILKKEQLREEEFVSVYALLQENKDNISSSDYYDLIMRYYLAYAGHSFKKFYTKVYHETFVGAHPSHQSRIDAVKKYMAEQKS